VPPLAFDGTADALLQPFDSRGRRHLEYVRDRGTAPDLPFDEMIRVFRESYPAIAFETWPLADPDATFAP